MTNSRKNRNPSFGRVQRVLLIVISVFLISGCNRNWLYSNAVNNVDFQARPEKEKQSIIQVNSEISLYKFDGKNMTVYSTKNLENVKRIFEDLGSVNTGIKTKTDPYHAEPPFYGIQIRTRGLENTLGVRWISDFAWYNGNLVTFEKKQFGLKFDFEELIHKIEWDTEETVNGASSFPCANYLFKGEDTWRYEYLTKAEDDIVCTKYEPYFPFISKNSTAEKETGPEINISVRLRLKNTEDGSDGVLLIDEDVDVTKLEVFHEGKWLSVPMHSKVKDRYADWKFDLHNEYGKEEEVNCNLTDIFGNLPPAHYRWKVITESGTVYVAFDVDETGHGITPELYNAE